MKRFAIITAMLVAAPIVTAQETHAGHGPPDPTAPVLGTIDFPAASTPASHEAFIRGVLLMHNFHYPEAAAAFVQAEQLDSSNAMAYWGEAMTYTHPVWNEQDTAAAHAALAKLGATRELRLARTHNPKERMWLEAVEELYAHGGTKAHRDTAYSVAMAKLYSSDPHDVEATTFYALSLLGLNQGNRDPGTYNRAYELLAPVFAAHPKHPGAAHYLIHAVDDPDHAGLGLAAANAYGEIAPSAAHALHMTSHIYLALGHWDDALKANLRAQSTIPNGRLSGHVSHWIHYSLVQLGRYHDADHWVDSMVRQATTGPAAMRQDSWNAAGIMASANLVDTHRYAASASRVRVDPKYFNADSYTEAIVDLAASHFGYGLAAIQRGDRAVADSALSFITSLAHSNTTDVTKTTSRGYAEVMEKTLRGYVLWKEGKRDDALRTFHDAAAQEAALPMPFGPPVVIKPPREAAGELLLEMKRPREAKADFMLALARTPLRPSVLLGLARSEKALGNPGESGRYYRQLRDIWHGADPDVPELSEVRAGGISGSDQ